GERAPDRRGLAAREDPPGRGTVVGRRSVVRPAGGRRRVGPVPEDAGAEEDEVGIQPDEVGLDGAVGEALVEGADALVDGPVATEVDGSAHEQSRKVVWNGQLYPVRKAAVPARARARRRGARALLRRCARPCAGGSALDRVEGRFYLSPAAAPAVVERMRVFLTGGTGLVGSYVASRLREQGHEVVALVRRESDARLLEPSGAARVEGDVCGPVERLAAAMAGCDAVVHAAALVFTRGGSAAFGRVNVEGTERVLHVSSIAVYGRQGDRAVLGEDVWREGRIAPGAHY